MALSIGTLVGYLQLDDSQFNRKADAADKKMQGLELHLKALSANNPKLKIDVEMRQIDELQARLVELKAQAADGVDVRVEMVATLAKLDALQARIRAMHNAEIKVNVDDKGALAKLEAIQAKVDGLGSKGGLLGSTLAFGPAFLPMINALPGGLFAIGSGAVASASGVGVLALAFHGLGDAVKAYNDYEAKLPFAKNAQQVADLKKQLALSAYGEQNSSGREFTRLVATKGSAAATGIKQSAQAGVFPGATKALRDILPLVPTVERLMKSLGHTVGDMTDEAAKALNSPFWRQWFAWLGRDASVQLPLVGSIFGHFIQGLMQAIQRFSPQGTSILTWIDDLSRRFDNWTGSPQFDKFMATTAEDAHLVAGALKPLGKILGDLYAGMSGAGAAELQVFGDVLTGIAHLPSGVIQVIGATLPIIFLGLKGIALTSSIVNGIQAIGKGFTFLAEQEGLAASATRGLAGAAGLGLLALSAHSSSQSLGLLGSAAGGALTGFAVGGPWGAGIGAVAGGLLHVAFAAKRSTAAAEEAIPVWQNYADTLNQVTGATTRATAKMVLEDLQKNKVFNITRAAGLGDREVVQAMLHAGAARDKVTAAIKRQGEAIAETYAKQDLAILRDRDAGKISADEAQKRRVALADEAAAQADLVKSTLEHIGAVQDEARTLLRNNSITRNYADLLKKGIPKNVATDIRANGLPATAAAVAELIRKYNVTDNRVIRTLITISGAPTTLAQIKKINQAADNAARARAITFTAHKLFSSVAGALGNGSAAGGTVPGQRYPYGDKVLTPTAPGEEIISNSHGQADRNREALKAANMGATLAVVGMASGGTVPDPLTGFGPDDMPSITSVSHKRAAQKRHHRGQTREQRLKQQLAQAKAMLSSAQDWASGFDDNVFGSDLATTKVVPGQVMTSVINGMKVVQTGADRTVNLSPSELLQSMIAAQNKDKAQAAALAKSVTKLRHLGVSPAVLDKMKAGGASGIAEIQALASGSVAQVKAFNSSVAATQGYLNEAGAQATTGKTYSDLQREEQMERRILRAVTKAISSTPIHLAGGHGNLRP